MRCLPTLATSLVLLSTLPSLRASPRSAQEDEAPSIPHEVVARFPSADEGRLVGSRTSSGGEAVALFVRKADGVELRISGFEPIRYDGYVHQNPDFDVWNVVQPMDGVDQHIAGDGAREHAYVDWESFAFDASGAHCAWLIYDHGAWRAVVDGVPQEGFDSVGNPVLGPNGHVACAVAKEGRLAASYDGRVGAFHAAVEELVFSASGAGFAYVAVEDDGERVVVFGAEPGAPFEEVYRGTLRFAGDDAHVSYLARRAGKDVAVIAGVESEPYDALGAQFLSSPDGKRQAYGVHSAEGWRIVLDGVAGPVYDVTGSWTFSPDGARFAHRGRRGERSHVSIDGQAGPEFDDTSDLIVFSPDGKRIGYGAIRDGRWIAVIDGKEGEPCDTLAAIVFSAEGAHVAHVEFVGPRFRVVVDGEEGELLEGEPTTMPSFRPGSAQVAMLVQGPEGKHLLLDGKLGPAWDWVTPPEFDARGEHCMVAAGKGEDSFVVLDGEPRPANGNFMTLPAFVRGGESLLYLVWRDDRAHLVLDDTTLATFEEYFAPAVRRLLVDERGGVTMLVRKGDELQRVRWAP